MYDQLNYRLQSQRRNYFQNGDTNSNYWIHMAVFETVCYSSMYWCNEKSPVVILIQTSWPSWRIDCIYCIVCKPNLLTRWTNFAVFSLGCSDQQPPMQKVYDCAWTCRSPWMCAFTTWRHGCPNEDKVSKLSKLLKWCKKVAGVMVF